MTSSLQYSMNKNRKKNSRGYRDLNIVLAWPCEFHLNRFFKQWKGSMSKFSLLRCDLCIHTNTVQQIHSVSRLKEKCCCLIALYMQTPYMVVRFKLSTGVIICYTQFRSYSGIKELNGTFYDGLSSRYIGVTSRLTYCKLIFSAAAFNSLFLNHLIYGLQRQM